MLISCVRIVVFVRNFLLYWNVNRRIITNSFVDKWVVTIDIGRSVPFTKSHIGQWPCCRQILSVNAVRGWTKRENNIFSSEKGNVFTCQHIFVADQNSTTMETFSVVCYKIRSVKNVFSLFKLLTFRILQQNHPGVFINQSLVATINAIFRIDSAVPRFW